jgi:transposase
VHVRRLAIDTHHYRRVRWFRDESDGWWREPWMSTIVNGDFGQVLGIVDGRDSAVGWLAAARSPAWRDPINVVAIDPSAAFRKGPSSTPYLRHAVVAVDGFHVQLKEQLRRILNTLTVDAAWTEKVISRYHEMVADR